QPVTSGGCGQYWIPPSEAWFVESPRNEGRRYYSDAPAPGRQAEPNGDLVAARSINHYKRSSPPGATLTGKARAPVCGHVQPPHPARSADRQRERLVARVDDDPAHLAATAPDAEGRQRVLEQPPRVRTGVARVAALRAEG